jgi:flagellar assembly factor FliW
MPLCTTKFFGTVAYDESAVVRFPAGLPGFENEARFLSLEQPAQHPLVFLQSLATPGLCFVSLPASSIDPAYELEVEQSDLDLLEVDPSREADCRKDLLQLALLTVSEKRITANLVAPVVINVGNLRAVQAVSPTRRYSHEHLLETLCC